MIGFVHAQHCDSINNHFAGHYNLSPVDMIQLSDGNLLVEAWQDSLTTHDINQIPISYLIKYYKIRRHDVAILDSIWYENDNIRTRIMARLHNNGQIPSPTQYNNVMITLSVEEDLHSYLNLAFFDDNLNFNDEMEVTIPIADTIIMTDFSYNHSFLLDSHNDVVFVYAIPTRHETHFARVGLDGTVKLDRVHSDDDVPNSYSSSVVHGLKQYCDNPPKYNYFGTGAGYAWGYELDDKFRVDDSYRIYGYHNVPGNNGMVTLNDSTVCFARNFQSGPFLWMTGIIKLGKVDGTDTLQLLNEAWFAPCPSQYNSIKGLGMEKDAEGNICYSFQSLDMDSCHYIGTVKLDQNLNILWERYALRMQAPSDFLRQTVGMKVLDDGGVVVFGFNHHYHWVYNGTPPSYLEPYLGGMFLVIFDDVIASTPEADVQIRPYLFYPNPVNDRLSIHYSPDVTPSRIEIYDLQGRLVRTQDTNFESLGMAGMTAGQYVMKVTMMNGDTYSDKVIKK